MCGRKKKRKSMKRFHDFPLVWKGPKIGIRILINFNIFFSEVMLPYSIYSCSIKMFIYARKANKLRTQTTVRTCHQTRSSFEFWLHLIFRLLFAWQISCSAGFLYLAAWMAWLLTRFYNFNLEMFDYKQKRCNLLLKIVSRWTFSC